MQRKILYGLGAIIAGALTLAAVANGPYYAFPAWAQKLICATTSNCPRFIELADWNSAAVLDRETGLVWEKSPSTSRVDWFGAQISCNVLSKGDRKGWRLPTLQELASLVDPTQSNPALPTGHPFQNVQTAAYWSATTFTGATSGTWFVSFFNGFVGAGDKVGSIFVWCVRGGQGVDPQ